MTKIAVFLPNWVGDLVMATPTLRALRVRYGEKARIVGLARPYLHGLLDASDWLDACWGFDPRGDEAVREKAVLRCLREERFDLAVLLTNSLRPAWICWRAGVPERIGYAANGRSLLLTGRVYWSRLRGKRTPIPAADAYLRIVEPLGILHANARPELRTSDEDQRAAAAVYESLGLRPDRVILLSNGGAYGAAKQWPPDRFADLARRIVDETDHDVLVLCGPKERDEAKAIVAKAERSNVASMADQELSWGLVKGCVEKGRLAVTTDSGPRHIAAALGVPVVTMYGPTIPAWIENPTINETHIATDIECLGCYERTCPLGHHRCMEDITVDRVMGELMRVLEGVGWVSEA